MDITHAVSVVYNIPSIHVAPLDRDAKTEIKMYDVTNPEICDEMDCDCQLYYQPSIIMKKFQLTEVLEEGSRVWWIDSKLEAMTPGHSLHKLPQPDENSFKKREAYTREIQKQKESLQDFLQGCFQEELHEDEATEDLQD